MTKISEFFLRITVVFGKIAATLFVPFVICQIPEIKVYPVIDTILSIGSSFLLAFLLRYFLFTCYIFYGDYSMIMLILFGILLYGIGSIISMSIMVSLLGIKDLYYTSHIQWILVILSGLFSWFTITIESIFIMFCLIYILVSKIYNKIKVYNILKNMKEK